MNYCEEKDVPNGNIFRILENYLQKHDGEIDKDFVINIINELDNGITRNLENFVEYNKTLFRSIRRCLIERYMEEKK